MSSAASRIALAAALLCSAPVPAAAQAWTPPAGTGTVTFIYQQIRNTGHRLTDGFLVPDGKSATTTVQIGADYAVTDRWSLSASLPYVFAKYIGPNPTPFPMQPVDACRCWQHGAQDIGLTARYNVRSGATAVTPSVSFGVPSHDYAYRGEAVVGRALKELQIAIDAGARLDAVWDRLVVQGRYGYTFVERVLDLPNNRSTAMLDGAVLLSRRAAVRSFVSWQRTHGGLRSGSLPPSDLPFPGEIDTPERVDEHDRLLRDNRWHAGIGASYSFQTFDVFGSYVEFVRGTDTHAGRSFTAGVSVGWVR